MSTPMPAIRTVSGFHGDPMNLPVADVDAAIPFYETMLGFRVASRADSPPRTAVLARDHVQIRLVENGGDPTDDGCAFHVDGLDALLTAFHANGLEPKPAITLERRGGVSFRACFVVAPDGLCYWFGERQG